jgi:hypothetical protein
VEVLKRTEALEKEDAAIKMFGINVITPLVASVPVIKGIIVSMPGRMRRGIGSLELIDSKLSNYATGAADFTCRYWGATESRLNTLFGVFQARI